MVKNFKTVTAKHKSKRGSLLSAQVTLSLKLALFGAGGGGWFNEHLLSTRCSAPLFYQLCHLRDPV